MEGGVGGRLRAAAQDVLALQRDVRQRVALPAPAAAGRGVRVCFGGGGGGEEEEEGGWGGKGGRVVVVAAAAVVVCGDVFFFFFFLGGGGVQWSPKKVSAGWWSR